MSEFLIYRIQHNIHDVFTMRHEYDLNLPFLGPRAEVDYR